MEGGVAAVGEEAGFSFVAEEEGPDFFDFICFMPFTDFSLFLPFGVSLPLLESFFMPLLDLLLFGLNDVLLTTSWRISANVLPRLFPGLLRLLLDGPVPVPCISAPKDVALPFSWFPSLLFTLDGRSPRR